MDKVKRFIIYLSSKEGFYTGKDNLCESSLNNAKWYKSYNGAHEVCSTLHMYQPQIMTIEIDITPLGLSEVITLSAVKSRRLKLEESKKEKLTMKMDEERERLLAQWNEEQKNNLVG